MARILLTVVSLLALTSAHAARCDKVEYAEAKDWSVEQVEKTYCDYFRAAKSAVDQRTAIYNIRKTTDTPRYRELTVESEACFEAAALLGRVIKNVHKRPYPPCT